MKKTLLKTCVAISTCGLLVGLLSGCAWSIGEGKEHTTVHKPTKGQELTDLKKAKDQGAITEAEYDAQKKQILDR